MTAMANLPILVKLIMALGLLSLATCAIVLMWALADLLEARYLERHPEPEGLEPEPDHDPEA